MCGICGFISSREAVLREQEPAINKMTASLSHRGPDDSGFFINKNIVLGHSRLSIIDLSGGHQPMFSPDKELVIVYNGEIYNFAEIRDELIKKGHRFMTQSDTEVILASYRQWGYDCLCRFNGMFAFAIYDQRDNSLFLARDRMGVKPLYYYFYNDDFVFASEIKAILNFPFVDRDVDLSAINEYLTFEYVPAPSSIYKNIRKLQHSHFMVFKNGSIRLERYWNENFRDKVNLSEEECVEKLKVLIDSSVKLRLVSDVPLGAFLSGGLDSSLIVAFMAKHSLRKVKTFNVAFDEKSFDESSFARRVSDFFGTEHHEEKLDAGTMLQIIPKIIGSLDEPFADASIIPTYLLSQFTRESVSVALSGDGGDELFAGYPTYQAHKIASFIPKPALELLRIIANRLPVSDENISFDFKLKKIVSGSNYSFLKKHQLWLGAFSPEEKQQLFSEEIRKEIKFGSEFNIVDYYQGNCSAKDLLDRVLYQDLQLYLQDGMLVKVDRASMAHSLEVRNPFLDYRLVEFASSLPSSLKLRLFTTKFILKKAVKGLLPEDIISRSKKGFGIPVAKWLKKELKPMLLEMLSEEKIKKEGFFNPCYINRLMEEHFTNRKDNRKLLWSLLVFEMWLTRNEVSYDG